MRQVSGTGLDKIAAVHVISIVVIHRGSLYNDILTCLPLVLLRMVLSLLLHVMILFELLCDLLETALLRLSYQPSLHRPDVVRSDTLLRYAIILCSVCCRLDISSCSGSH